MTAPESTVTAPPAAWRPGRFLLAVAALFAIQVGIIVLVAERPQAVASNSRPSTTFRALPAPLDQDGLAQTFFAADPIVFASATLHGFSGNAWLRFQPTTYGPAEELDPPAPVELDTRLFGTKLRLAEETNPVPFQLAEGRGAQLEPLPVFTTLANNRTQSTCHLEGPLAGRQVVAVTGLRSWPAPQVLTNTVVEFAVNRVGLVVLHRLAARSGLSDADLRAVAITRGLRFSPLPATAGELTWSKAIFEWQTLEPAAK